MRNGGCLIFAKRVCVCVGGGGGRSGLLYLLSIVSFSHFLGDGLILDGNSQRAVKSKPFKKINSKITKSSGILEYFLTLTLRCFSGKRNVDFCVFLPYSVTYNVKFTIIIMPHRIYVINV